MGTCTIVLQMLPLLKRSTDNLVAVVGENATSGRSFDVAEYVYYDTYILASPHVQLFWFFLTCRVYTSFTLETVLATAFGRLINIQRGESDDFSKSMDLLLEDFTDGKIEKLVMLRSKLKPWSYQLYI